MPAERIREIVEQTNSLKADVIVLLGDFAASHKFKTRSVAPEVWAEAFSGLKAPLGVHAILGNHDWWDDVPAQRTRQGPVWAGACSSASASPSTRTTPPASSRMAVASGSPASAIRWPY